MTRSRADVKTCAQDGAADQANRADSDRFFPPQDGQYLRATLDVMLPSDTTVRSTNEMYRTVKAQEKWLEFLLSASPGVGGSAFRRSRTDHLFRSRLGEGCGSLGRRTITNRPGQWFLGPVARACTGGFHKLVRADAHRRTCLFVQKETKALHALQETCVRAGSLRFKAHRSLPIELSSISDSGTSLTQPLRNEHEARRHPLPLMGSILGWKSTPKNQNFYNFG